MDKPCLRCAAYDEDQDNCRTLVKLQALHLDRLDRLEERDEKLESRRPLINELLVLRPCRFSLWIMRWADDFINRRGLKLKDKAGIHNDVVISLTQLDFRYVKPAYEDFRPYAKAITRSAVNQVYSRECGEYCCGTCDFFLSGSKRCACPDLESAPGHQYIRVNYSTNPGKVIHAGGLGCRHYSSIQVVSLSEMDLLTAPDEREVEDTIAYMESLGPRQREQAMLIRLILDDYDFESGRGVMSRVSAQLDENRTNISKKLHGEDREENDDAGNAITYHQAGAFDLFRAIYTGAVFDLQKNEEESGVIGQTPMGLWQVVNRRDFGPEEVQPSFRKIAGEFDIIKPKAINLYINGWDWINKRGLKGGSSVSGQNGSYGKEISEQSRPARRTASATHHADSHALLSYANGRLDREARRRIGAHILICARCSAELEQIDAEAIAVPDRPISVRDRLTWLVLRSTGRLSSAGGTNNIEERDTRARLTWLGNAWLLFPRWGSGVLLVAAIFLIVLMAGRARYGVLERDVIALRQQNESLRQEESELRKQVEEAVAAKAQLQERLIARQAESDQIASRSESEKKAGHALRAKRLPQPHVMAAFNDGLGVVVVRSDGTVEVTGNTNATANLPRTVLRSVSEFVITGAVTPAEQVRTAQATMRSETTLDALRTTQSSGRAAPIPLSPVHSAVRSNNPTLQWAPIAGAQEYQVMISYPEGKENGRIVFHKNVGSQTRLTVPSDLLQRGQVYLWQVEAIVEDQARVSPAIGFFVLSHDALRKVEVAEQRYNESALVLASIYATYGLYEEALDQVEKLSSKNQDNPFAQMMLKRLHRQLGKE